MEQAVYDKHKMSNWLQLIILHLKVLPSWNWVCLMVRLYCVKY